MSKNKNYATTSCLIRFTIQLFPNADCGFAGSLGRGGGSGRFSKGAENIQYGAKVV
jgi:hypothetical protein